MKKDLSCECGFLINTPILWKNQDELNVYYEKYCSNCVHMSEVCMNGEGLMAEMDQIIKVLKRMSMPGPNYSEEDYQVIRDLLRLKQKTFCQIAVVRNLIKQAVLGSTLYLFVIKCIHRFIKEEFICS